MTTVRIDYYGMEGQGRNVTEAKRDAGRKISEALSGSYTPEVIVWRGFAMLVYREPQGWSNRLIADPERGLIDGPVHGTCYGDREESIRHTRSHLAQCGWRPEDGDEIPEVLKGTGRQAEADFRHWVGFQLRYARARAAGLSDWDAHDYGCGALGRPDLIEAVDGTAVA